MSVAKPRVGTIVDYFAPHYVGKTGRLDGWSGRGEGPYAAIVSNDIGAGVSLTVFLPEIDPVWVLGVPHKDDENKTADKGFWEYRTPIEKARATEKDEKAA